MRLSTIGLVGGIMLASVAPAFAQTASISGSATLTTPASFTSTVSGESILPRGFFFDAPGTTTITPAVFDPTATPPVNTSAVLAGAQVFVVPAYQILGTSPVVTSLSVGSTVAPTPVTGGASFTAAAAALLTTLSDPATTVADANTILLRIEGLSAIIRAGAGVDGLD